jgi:hypothetical protein
MIVLPHGHMNDTETPHDLMVSCLYVLVNLRHCVHMTLRPRYLATSELVVLWPCDRMTLLSYSFPCCDNTILLPNSFEASGHVIS